MEISLVRNLLYTLFLLVLISCREEIIEPGNFAGNINEPVQVNIRNSYTLVMNAKKFTMNLSVPASFSSTESRISYTVLDVESGYVDIRVKDFYNVERYSFFIATELTFYTDIMDGFVPKTINIRTESFSGKIRIQLTNAN